MAKKRNPRITPPAGPHKVDFTLAEVKKAFAKVGMPTGHIPGRKTVTLYIADTGWVDQVNIDGAPAGRALPETVVNYLSIEAVTALRKKGFLPKRPHRLSGGPVVSAIREMQRGGLGRASNPPWWNHAGGGCLLQGGGNYPCDDTYVNGTTGEEITFRTTQEAHFRLPEKVRDLSEVTRIHGVAKNPKMTTRAEVVADLRERGWKVDSMGRRRPNVDDDCDGTACCAGCKAGPADQPWCGNGACDCHAGDICPHGNSWGSGCSQCDMAERAGNPSPYPRVMAALRRAGLHGEVTNTGGNVMAIVAPLSGGYEIFLNSGQGDLPDTDRGPWNVALIGPDHSEPLNEFGALAGPDSVFEAARSLKDEWLHKWKTGKYDTIPTHYKAGGYDSACGIAHAQGTDDWSKVDCPDCKTAEGRSGNPVDHRVRPCDGCGERSCAGDCGEGTLGAPSCPACGGEGNFLGQLGHLEHFRCRACGMDFSRKA